MTHSQTQGAEGAGTKTGEPQGAWMQTFCLPHFPVLDPDPSQILIEDIAHHLSQNVRYGGAGIRFLSVAEHSVHMARAASPEHALWALLHDASETYLHDLVRPVKRSLAGYAQAEDRIMRAVCERFGLRPEMPAEVKRLDNRILIDETRQNMRPTDVVWSFGGETEPLGVTLQFWTPEQAEREFLATFAAITGQTVTVPAAPAPSGTRETIARVVAPDMWARFDRYGGLGDADVPEGNNISWMVSDSLSMADAILAAFPAALSTPAPAATPGVPDSVRALSEDYARKIDARRAASRAYNDAYDAILKTGRSPKFDELLAERNASQKAEQERDAAQAHLLAACLYIAAHPAGQAGDAGAERAYLERRRDLWLNEAQRLAILVRELGGDPEEGRAPNSTRTGAAETDGEIAHAGYYGASVQSLHDAWTALPQTVRDNWKRAAAALAARPEAPSDAGWVLVPERMDVDMIAAFWRWKNTGSDTPGEFGDDRSDAAAWRAMIAARPLPTPPSDPAPSGQAEG